MQNLWSNLPTDLFCTPKELYDDLRMMGYDWEQLLDTRGYWVYENDKHPQNFLSTKDLLMMRAGKYQPKWATRNTSVAPVTNVVEPKPKHLVEATLGDVAAA